MLLPADDDGVRTVSYEAKRFFLTRVITFVNQATLFRLGICVFLFQQCFFMIEFCV